MARERGSLFLSVMLTCDIDEQVGRIDNADRVALRKGSPEAYRGHRLHTRLFQPPTDEVIELDTTETARLVLEALRERGYVGGSSTSA